MIMYENTGKKIMAMAEAIFIIMKD